MFQISSRQSVLLVDTTKEKVYKYPFSRMLDGLMENVADKVITLLRSEIPRVAKLVGIIQWYVSCVNVSQTVLDSTQCS